MPEPKLSKESEHNLVFKPITLDSLSEIEPFLHRQCYRTCDFSIGGIYIGYLVFLAAIPALAGFINLLQERYPSLPAGD